LTIGAELSDDGSHDQAVTTRGNLDPADTWPAYLQSEMPRAKIAGSIDGAIPSSVANRKETDYEKRDYRCACHKG
jgi:hypothetical protein